MSFWSWFKRKEKKSYVTEIKGGLYKRQRKKLHKITYRQEMVTDGKSNKLYGPYWYGYYRQEGKLHKIYIGKERKDILRG